ncbi:MAG: VOC family protein, partial [Myxococcota bacterium]|nr:VOC family protein [Myxococcota bacterium]
TPDANSEAKRLQETGLSPSDPEPGLAQDERSGAFRRFYQVSLPLGETYGVGLSLIQDLTEPELIPPSLPVASEAAVVSRLDHVVVQTKDPERAIDLYGERLGLRLALDRSFEKRGVRLLFFRVGGTTLEVASRLEKEASRNGPRSARPDHLWGLAYQVPDIDLASRRMADAGLDVTSIRDGHKPGTRVCSVRGDPLGIPTLVIEPVAE